MTSSFVRLLFNSVSEYQNRSTYTTNTCQKIYNYMLNPISARQNQILKLLLTNRDGLTIDEVSQALDISRSAIQQHFAVLESNQFITPISFSKTAGRPVRVYVISEKGINHFPKQYAWFSELILNELKIQMGEAGFQQFMTRLGVKLAESLLAEYENQPLSVRVEKLTALMDNLGFHVSLKSEAHKQSIEACNCIYHDIAQKHPEVCEFDKALINTLLGKKTALVECAAKGGHLCRFTVINDD